MPEIPCRTAYWTKTINIYLGSESTINRTKILSEHPWVGVVIVKSLWVVFGCELQKLVSQWYAAPKKQAMFFYLPARIHWTIKQNPIIDWEALFHVLMIFKGVLGLKTSIIKSFCVIWLFLAITFVAFVGVVFVWFGAIFQIAFLYYSMAKQIQMPGVCFLETLCPSNSLVVSSHKDQQSGVHAAGLPILLC